MVKRDSQHFYFLYSQGPGCAVLSGEYSRDKKLLLHYQGGWEVLISPWLVRARSLGWSGQEGLWRFAQYGSPPEAEFLFMF
jgi:hypothetical protein